MTTCTRSTVSMLTDFFSSDDIEVAAPAEFHLDIHHTAYANRDSSAYREKRLIDERPWVQVWHEQLADMIATVMQEHGQSTPRGVATAHGRGNERNGGAPKSPHHF